MSGVVDWSLRTWKDRHNKGYFPRSEEHANWLVYDAMLPWFIEFANPTITDTALEIGCGYGQWMIPLSKHVAHVSGFDIHPVPVAKAIEKFSEHQVFNASVGLGFGDKIAYANDSFSLVYSISVFQHLPRLMVGSYLAETLRVLKQGGRCLHHFRNMNNVGPYPTPAKDIVIDHKGDFSCGWTAKEVADAAINAGLKNVNVIDIGLFLLLQATK